jgi:hypothetical protein
VTFVRTPSIGFGKSFSLPPVFALFADKVDHRFSHSRHESKNLTLDCEPRAAFSLVLPITNRTHLTAKHFCSRGYWLSDCFSSKRYARSRQLGDHGDDGWKTSKGK